MSMMLISLHEVRKYDVQKPYNLVINQGDFIILKGHNGSGKTTLMRLLLGFIKPDQGKIIRYCDRIAYLPEHVQLPHFMKAYVYINIFERMKHKSIDTELLHLFDIPLFRYISNLSKGNKQKLAIVTNLIGKSDLILLDEPLSGLDENSIHRLVNYLRILKENGQTIMISSHHHDAFESVKTREIIL